MKKSVFKYLFTALLVLGMVVPMLAGFSNPAFAAEGSYAEENGWLNSSPAETVDYAYSIAVVGDTQSIVKKDLTNGTNYMSSIYSWLASESEAKKIQYVLGVGDITEYVENFDSNFDGSFTYADEWDHAKAAITLLDGKIPYSLCRGGGHDTSKMLNEYFANHEYYASNLDGTFKENDVTSSYSTFTVGEVDYLVIALDWNPSDELLGWTEGIIEANSEKRVILTTHAYLAADGTLHGSKETHTSVPELNNGVDIYEKLVSKYDNIQLVISGHNPSANLVYRQDVRAGGSVVTSLLVDPQTFDTQNNGETGMVCMLYFSEDGNDMSVEWISTVREQYYKAENQFTLSLDEYVTDEGIVTKYGTIPSKFANPDLYPFLCFVDGEFTDYGAYDLFNYGSGTLERSIRKLSADKNVVIIARKDITVIDNSSGYLATNYTSAKITVDLMGHTVYSTTKANLISSAATQTYNTDFTFKNGTFVLGSGLLSVSTGGDVKTQNFTFEDVDIVSNHKELIVFNKHDTIGSVNIDFIDCDITSSTLGNVFRAGNSADSDKSITAKVNVRGGIINLQSFDQTKFVQEYNGSSVTFFAGSDGNLTKVIVPTGSSVTGVSYKGVGADLYLVKDKVGATSDTYVMESLVTPYGTIPYELSSHVEYPFLAFVDGNVIKLADGKTYDLFMSNLDNTTTAGEIERTLRNKNTTGATVIARTDFVVNSNGNLATNYMKALLTIDLMGHTIDATAAGHLFASNGTQTFNNSILVKNGTLILGKGLITVSTHSNAPGKTQEFTFQDLNIVSLHNELIIYNKCDSVGNVNVNFNNCNISGNFTGSIFRAGKGPSDTNNNIKATVTVKGGSVTLGVLEEDKFVQELNGGSVTFLPDAKGEYLTLRIKNSTANSFVKEYKTNLTTPAVLAKVEEDGSYGVYTFHTLYTWLNLAGNSAYTAYVKLGDDPTAFNSLASEAISNSRLSLTMLVLSPDGSWTLNGTTFTSGKKVSGITANFKASVGMTVHKNFDINFMVDANSYNYLDDATKALFTQVGDYYVVTESAERAVNQAFTKAEYDLVIVEGDYTYTAHYKASIVDYVARNFAEGSVATEKNKAMAYYIAAYLNSAYAHFDSIDVTDYSALTAIVTAQSKNYVTGLTPDVKAGDYSALAGNGVEIAIDLKSTPKYVITSATYAGTVTFNGVTTSFAAGETVELSASVLNFDNALTITLQDADNSTGTYSLANYVENTLANESYSAELKALVKAFSDYVVYAENFR